MHLGSIHSTALIWEERENGLKEETSYMEWSRVRCDKNWVDVLEMSKRIVRYEVDVMGI